MSAWRWQTAKAMARKYPSTAAGANRSVESERSTHELTSCRSQVELTLRDVRGPLLEERFPARSAAGGADVMTVVTVFDPEVTTYDVRLPGSRRYGEGKCWRQW
jgi:hypothetical protein